MGYLSCNAESAIATCDSYNWDPKQRRNKTKPKPNNKLRNFTYHDLVTATNGFSADAFLGKGSHGAVYRATLDNGKLIAAVKKTTTHSISHPPITLHSNCTACAAPADNEIEVLSWLHHPRLVNLIGFCQHSVGNTKLLVVEYMPNGSLHGLLHNGSKPLGWTRRIRFALQVAKAVRALHGSNPPVIHRDIKSSNVLIDEKWGARLGDFGLALRGHVEDVRVRCTPPAGTLGYLDPGYLAPGDLSTKSDVFSFGILLLEIISGRNAIDLNYSPPSVVEWAVPLIKRGDFAAICDRRIGFPVDPAVARNMAVLAARCVRSTPEKRPEMAEVVEVLKVARKRVHAPPILTQLRKRVGCVQKTQRLEEKLAVDGSKRNKKLSSVSRVEKRSDAIDWERDRVIIRSKSIGSITEAKTRFDLQRKKGGGVAVKMAAVKLSKSRSTGVLKNPRLVRYDNREYVLEFGRNETQTTTFDGSFEQSEEELQERPLVVV